MFNLRTHCNDHKVIKNEVISSKYLEYPRIVKQWQFPSIIRESARISIREVLQHIKVVHPLPVGGVVVVEPQKACYLAGCPSKA